MYIVSTNHDQVGTSWKFGVKSSGTGTSTTSTSSYGTTGFVAGLPIDPGTRPLSYPQSFSPSYSRAALSDQTFEDYQYPLQHLNTAQSESQFADDRAWTDRPSTSMNALETAYGSSYRLADALAPLSLSSLQGPPPPIERRLPAPKLVGTPISPDSITSPTASVSGRFASLSISGPGRHSTKTAVGRQNSIQDLANASIMLPSASGQDYQTLALLPKSTDSAGLSYPILPSSAEDLYASCASVSTAPQYSTALPPMQIPSNAPRYSQDSTGASSASVPAVPKLDRQQVSHRDQVPYTSEQAYASTNGWTTANASTHSRRSMAKGGNDDHGPRYHTLAPLAPAPSSHNEAPPDRKDSGRRGKSRADKVESSQSHKSQQQGSQSSHHRPRQDDMTRPQRKPGHSSGSANL